MNGFTIEHASASDAKAIADVYQDRPATTFNRLTHDTVDATAFNSLLEDMFAESLRDPNEVTLVARDERDPDRIVVSYVNLAKREEVVPMTAEQIDAARTKYEQRVKPGMNAALLVELWQKLDRMTEQAMSGRGSFWGLENVGTLKTHQGRGIATALIRAALEECFARENELPVYLDTSGDNDSMAWRLYERLGFERVGEFQIDLAKHRGEGVHKHLAMMRKPNVRSATGTELLDENGGVQS